MEIQESYNDFTRKYENCYFKITAPSPGLFKFSHLDGEYLVGEVITGDKLVTTTLAIKDFESEFEWPELGIINLKRNVIFVQRAAARQWKRCFCFGSGRMFTSIPLMRGIGSTLNAMSQSPSVLNAMFYPEYFTPAVAFKKVSSGNRISAAINPRFYIGVNGVLPFVYLGYKNYCVGRVEKGRFILFPQASHLYEELVDLSKFEVTIGDKAA